MLVMMTEAGFHSSFLEQHYFFYSQFVIFSQSVISNMDVTQVLSDLCCCNFHNASSLRMQEKKKKEERDKCSPLLAPDSSAVRERLPGSSELHGWRQEDKRRRDENAAHTGCDKSRCSFQRATM